MPAIGLNADDAKAVAAYVRSVVATIEGQGKPPSGRRGASDHRDRRCDRR